MIVSETILVQSCQRTLLQTSDLGIARFARFYLLRSKQTWGVRPNTKIEIRHAYSVRICRADSGVHGGA